MRPNISNPMMQVLRLLLVAPVFLAAGCLGGGDTPTEGAPAAKGASGVPVLSKEQMDKLPTEQQKQIQKDQDALQKAAEANRMRRQTGQMPGGG